MSSSTDAEKDTRLAALVKTMHERVPKEKRLTADVILQLLKSKYTAIFPEEYLSMKGEFISSLIHSLYAGGTNSGTAAASNGSPKGNIVNDDSSTDDDDEEEEEEDDEDEDEEDDDDNEGGEESEEDEDDFESDDDDDEEDDDDDDDDEHEEKQNGKSGSEPAEKRRRLEGESAVLISAGGADGDLAQRCVAMAECLRKLSYRPRRQEAGESLETYLEQYLVPLFREKGLDPERYSKADMRKYLVLKELEQLKADGADINLERSMRAGRGFNNTPTGVSTVNVKISNFLDDDE